MGENRPVISSGEQMPLSVVRGFSPSALLAAMARKSAKSADLAEAIGASRQSVDAWIKGKATPSPALLSRAAKWLNTPVADLVPLDPDQLRLSDMRVRAGLSQKAAAAELMMSATALTDVEKGRRKVDSSVAGRMAALYRQEQAAVEQAWARTNAVRRAYLDSL